MTIMTIDPNIFDVKETKNTYIVSLKKANPSQCNKTRLTDALYVYIDSDGSCICAIEIEKNALQQSTQIIAQFLPKPTIAVQTTSSSIASKLGTLATIAVPVVALLAIVIIGYAMSREQ